MENILIWIVLFAIGALWEFVGKKKGESRSRTASGSAPKSVGNTATRVSAPRPAPYTPPVRHPERTKTVYQSIPVSDDQTVQEVEILADTPLPDSIENTSSPQSDNNSSDTQLDREAHFRRWRQAIIDTQVLERKF